MTTGARGYFSSTSIDSALAALLTLPGALRPRQYADGEQRPKKGHSVDEPTKFAKFVKDNPQGYTLFAERCRFGVTPRFKGHYGMISVHENDVPVPDEPEDGAGMTDQDVEIILQAFELGGGQFCHAGSEGEYHHRNRYFVELDAERTLEAWVGRDLEKYLPGLYWRCSVALPLAEAFGLTELDLQCGECSMDEHFWRLKVRGEPKDWRVWSEELDASCARLSGIFSLDRIRAELLVAKSYRDISAVLARYR